MTWSVYGVLCQVRAGVDRPFPVLGVIRTVIRTEVGSGSMARPVFTLNTLSEMTYLWSKK